MSPLSDDAVPHPDVVERVLALDVVGPGGQVMCPVVSLTSLGHAHLDAAEGVDHVPEAVEVDDDEVVDADVRELLDGLDVQAGPPTAYAALNMAQPTGVGAVAVLALARRPLAPSRRAAG